MKTQALSLRLCQTLLAAATIVRPVFAQVPVNDAARTTQETNTAVCMERARTFKQSSVAPSRGVTTSVTSTGDLAGIEQVSGVAVGGSELSGTSIANSDWSILLAAGQGVQALKARNAGQVVNALATVAAAIGANSATLKTQQTAIGRANSLQGAFDQNTAARLSGAQIWNQAIQAVTTTVQMRNQRLLDQAAADSAATNIMRYEPGSASFVDGR